MFRSRTRVPAGKATVVFLSRGTAQELARFDGQSERQVEQLLAFPPSITRHVAYDVAVTAA